MDKNLDINPDLREELLLESKIAYLSSKFSFLAAHNGLRMGKVHCLLGTPSGGKSTLIRSMTFDVLNQIKDDESVMVWLSEEKKRDFFTEMYKCEMHHEKYKRLFVYSEQEENGMLQHNKDLFSYIKQRALKEKCKVLIFDNITTSFRYGNKSPKQQLDFLLQLKELVAEINVAFIVVCHTNKHVHDNLDRFINVNDVRGVSDISNLAEFFYIMQRFSISNEYFSMLQIAKHRGQDVRDKYFKLQYNRDKFIYENDTIITQKDINGAFELRNRLKKR